MHLCYTDRTVTDKSKYEYVNMIIFIKKKKQSDIQLYYSCV